jgi:hypothetical protein
VFVDVIPVSAVLYIINFANCYQTGPKKATKEAKEGREGKESNHNRKEKEIVQKYESGVHVSDLANMHSMSKSAFFIIKRLGKGCFGRFGTHYGYFQYFSWEK